MKISSTVVNQELRNELFDSLSLSALFHRVSNQSYQIVMVDGNGEQRIVELRAIVKEVTDLDPHEVVAEAQEAYYAKQEEQRIKAEQKHAEAMRKKAEREAKLAEREAKRKEQADA